MIETTQFGHESAASFALGGGSLGGTLSLEMHLWANWLCAQLNVEF